MADISITPSAVLKSSSAQVSTNGTAGATITQGQVCYLDTSDSSKLKLADSNAGSVGDAIRAGLQFALNAASAGQPIAYVTFDPSLTSGGTLTSGTTIYLSNTAGGITATYADLATGSTVVQLGVVNTDGTLNFAPLIGGTK